MDYKILALAVFVVVSIMQAYRLVCLTERVEKLEEKVKNI